MLQIQHIRKEYRTGNLVQKALDDVSLNLRDNEFVAILGPSGSGKTTLLNIIGGLDRYDSGDLIINGISTRKYHDRDWDSYRNHTIGFVFQSYNLIPHQTVLANVELALTISGVSRAQRRQRAVQALKSVGLGEQMHKKPSQMSGGQMQRVAIARALVNDPDILLADEPTGALDSDTSIQVMDLLREVARDRLVVMVTHNPELAEAYATRIVNLKDGKIRSDSDPLVLDDQQQAPPVHKNMGKASMSFLTALSLSFNNLKTKKARTLLTSFAGSIGIIGIALILALSNGVNTYIRSIEQDTLSEYPLQIQSTGMNFSSLINSAASGSLISEEGDVRVSEMLTSMFSTVDANDLSSLKAWLDSGESGMDEVTRAIEYHYNVTPRIVLEEADGGVRQVNPDRSLAALGLGSSTSSNFMSSMMSTNVFYEMPRNEDLYLHQYDVKAGRWPQAWNECVIVLSANGSISDFLLYTLGLREGAELDAMVDQFAAGQNVDTPQDLRSYSYEELLGITFKLLNPAELYEYDPAYGIWRDRSENEAFLKEKVAQAETLTVVGIVQPAEGTMAAMLNYGINYPASLTEHVAQAAADSAIVQAQMADPSVNVLSGEPFGEENSDVFQLDSLISIDEQAMQEAFQFDLSALKLDAEDLAQAMDFSNMDLGSVSLPDLPAVDWSQLLSQIEINASQQQLQQLAQALLQGYQQYAAQHPEADYSGLAEDFSEYLRTPEAIRILSEALQQIIEANGGLALTVEQVQQLIGEVMSGFVQWAVQQPDYSEGVLSDPDQFNAWLQRYLSTQQAQELIRAAIQEILQTMPPLNLPQDVLESMAGELAQGYLEYAQQKGLPDPSRISEHVLAYLSTPQASDILTSALAEMIDTGNLEGEVQTLLQGYITQVVQAYASVVGQALADQIGQGMQQMMQQLPEAFEFNSDAFAEAIKFNMDEQELSELLMSLMSAEGTSYEGNLQSFGYADLSSPSGIDLYSRDFESKAVITELLDGYNSRMEASGQSEKVISYMDLVGTMMSSVTEIIDIISYVLVAFVAISLVVSSMLIGILTYTSVLERKKEIGILRAIGASKRNISQVFNAETFIIGLCAGMMGILVTLLLLIPGNAIIHSVTGEPNINAVLPAVQGTVLVVLSIILTLIGGLFPARKAAKSDPVTALRTE